jgi:uncharacterized protein YdeI (YjbR/CyaY-like superfamily)
VLLLAIAILARAASRMTQIRTITGGGRMAEVDLGTLKRPLQPMPEYVRKALEERGMWDAYRSRPAYQQNDYLGWISRAKREETKQKRLRQMLDELEGGNLYMNMAYRPR